MYKLGIILDSTVDQLKITNLFKDAENVSLSFIETKDLVKHVDTTDFYISKKSNPKSFIDSIESIIKNKVDYILVLTSSDALTTSYANAHLAKDILKDIDFDIFDSKTFGAGIYYLLMCIKQWIHKDYSYPKVKDMLKKHIDLGVTWVITDNFKLDKNSSKLKRILKPFVKSYILTSKKDYQIDTVIYNNKKTIDILYQQILGYIGFDSSAYIFVYSGLDTSKAKLLQHELYTKNKSLNISLYGAISESISNYFKENSYGIYLGHYEETKV